MPGRSTGAAPGSLLPGASRGPLALTTLFLAACSQAAPSLGPVSLDPIGRAAQLPGAPATVRLEGPPPGGGYGLAALPSTGWDEARATCYSPTAMTGGAGQSLPFASWTYFPGGAPPYYQNNAGTLPLPPVRPASDYRLGYDLIKNLSATQKMVRAFGYLSNQTLVPGANSVHVTFTNTGTVSTVAGAPGYGDGGPAASAIFDQPNGVVLDAAGNVFVADSQNHRIAKISTGGTATTLAGAGFPYYANATGTGAFFNVPTDLVFDSAGNLLVADFGNSTIRKVTPAGVVTTYAGAAGAGYLDGPLASAKFNGPIGLAIDASNNLYVSEYSSSRIRRIDGATGAVTTVAGSGTMGFADGVGAAASFNGLREIELDGAGNLYAADFYNCVVRKVVLATGEVSTFVGNPNQAGYANGIGTAALLAWPLGLAKDGAGNLYVSEYAGNRLRKVVLATASVSLVAGSSTIGHVDDPVATSGKLANPSGVTCDAAGNIYFCDLFNHAVRKISTAGALTTVAGSVAAGMGDGPAAAARFRFPAMLSVDAAGNVYVADCHNNAIRKITPGGTVSTLAGDGYQGTLNQPQSVYAAPDGYVYFADAYHDILRVPAAGGSLTLLAGSASTGYADGTGTAASFFNPRGMAMDSSGNLFIADQSNGRIRKLVPATGVVTTFAGNGAAGFADGVGAAASFYNPRGLSIDAQNNLYVADISNQRIRKIAPNGAVTTVAGSAAGVTEGVGGKLNNPYGVSVDAGGNLFVADLSNYRLRKVALDGFVATLAGGPASYGYANGAGDAARFFYIVDVAAAADGSVYAADFYNHAIRKVK